MKNVFQKIAGILGLAVFMLVFFSGISVAELTISKITVSPPKTEIAVGSGKIVLTVKASGGKNLKFQWELQGQGKFEEPTTKSAVFYIPPETINGTSAQAIITVTVTADGGQEATDNVSFTIMNTTALPKPTSTPVLDSPLPPDNSSGCAYIKADEENVEFSPVQDRYPTWRQTWDFPKIGFGEAKKKGATEILVHQITKGEDGEHRLWRFGTNKDSGFYYASFPKSSKIQLGNCWKEVKRQSDKASTSPDGVKHEFDYIIFYVLIQQ